MIYKSFETEPLEAVSHNPKITKRVLVRNGQCGNITQLARSVFPPGERVEPHAHPDMIEVFMVRSGCGQVIVNGQTLTVKVDQCIVVEAGETHEVINAGSDDLVFDYFGLQV